MNIETIFAIGIGAIIGLAFAVGYYLGFKAGLDLNLEKTQ